MSGNGVNTTYAYDEAGRLEGVETTSAADRVMGISYTRYPGGETFTALRDHLEDRSDALELDSLYRVVGFERGLLDAKARVVETPATSGLQGQSWDLDDAMNWANTTQTLDGVSVVQTRSHNTLNQVTSVDRDGTVENLTYDLNGNLVENTTMRFQWDYANRLRSVERVGDGATIAVYEYDALNRRVSKNVTNTSNDGYTRFYHDGQHEVEEWSAPADAGGARLVARYVYGSRTDEVLTMDRFDYLDETLPGLPPPLDAVTLPDAVVEAVCPVLGSMCSSYSRRRYYYHQDAQMTVHAVTDAAGTVQEGYVYQPYGGVTVVKPGFSGQVEWSASDVVQEDGESGIGNQLQYTARRIDPETGLHQYRARYYSTDLGRFISSDPIGAWGDGGNLGNGYTYVGNGPHDATDSSGLHQEIGGFAVCNGDTWQDNHRGCRIESPWDTNTDFCRTNVGGGYAQVFDHSQHVMVCLYRDSGAPPPQQASSSSEPKKSESVTEPSPPAPPPPPPPPPPPAPAMPRNHASLFDDLQSFGSYCGGPRPATAATNAAGHDGLQQGCIGHDKCLDRAYDPVTGRGPDTSTIGPPPFSQRGDVQGCNAGLVWESLTNPGACLNPSATNPQQGSDLVLDLAFGAITNSGHGRQAHCFAYQGAMNVVFTAGLAQYGNRQAQNAVWDGAQWVGRRTWNALRFW